MGLRAAVTLAQAVTIVAALAACGGDRKAAAPPATPLCPGARLSCAQLTELGLTYPYPRERGSFLFVNGAAFPYVRITPRLLGDSRVRTPGGAPIAVAELLRILGVPREAGALTPVLAYGSNANVQALTRKYLAPGPAMTAVVPVIKGRLRGYDVTWAPQLVFNGAMPATLTPSPGTEVSVWTTWLGGNELRRMNATEGVGSLYSVGHLDGARIRAPGPPHGAPLVYEDCRGTVRLGRTTAAIAGVPARGRRFPGLTSPQALDRVAPAVGWHGSAAALVADNVRHPGRRADRDRRLAALAKRVPDPAYRATRPCRSSAPSS